MIALYLPDPIDPGPCSFAFANLATDAAAVFIVLPLFLVVVAITAFPGAVILSAAARVLFWSGWPPVTLGGGLTGRMVLVAIYLQGGRKPSWPEGMILLAFSIAGALGGLAFWWCAFRLNAACLRGEAPF